MRDEQATHMQLGGLDLAELEAQRAGLLPDRIEMRRRRRRRGSRPGLPPGVGCLHLMGVYPPGHPCFYGDYENFD